MIEKIVGTGTVGGEGRQADLEAEPQDPGPPASRPP